MSYFSGSEIKLSRSTGIMSLGVLALVYFIFIKLMNTFILHFCLEAINTNIINSNIINCSSGKNTSQD